jgi:hypothetical protein
MASMNLEGPHNLTYDLITTKVEASKPGVFALGYVGNNDIFYVNYVGRSDGDIRARLLEYIGSDVAFKFAIAESPRLAFVRECELFHKLRPRGNFGHPSRPPVSDWTCPRCSMLGWR